MSHKHNKGKTEEKNKVSSSSSPPPSPSSKEEEKERRKKEEEKAKRKKENEKRRSDIADRLRNELGEKGFFLPSSAFRRELQERTRAIRVLALQDDSSSDEEDDDDNNEKEKEGGGANIEEDEKKKLEEALLKRGGAGGSRGKRDMSKVASLMLLRQRKQPLTKLEPLISPEEPPVSNSYPDYHASPISSLPPPPKIAHPTSPFS